MKFKKIIDAIKENLVNNEKCDECNQLLTECDCNNQSIEAELESNTDCENKS